MGKIIIVLITIPLLIISCSNSRDNYSETAGTIKIIELSPEPQTSLSPTDTIRAVLEYSIPENLESDYGFGISIQFVSVQKGKTFTMIDNATADLETKQGVAEIEFPMDSIWDQRDLKHPVACYFYLHQYYSEYSSDVLAATEKIVYQE